MFCQMYRYVFDTTLTGKRQRVVADFIVYCGLSNAALRDEIYVQLCNLTFTRSTATTAADQSTAQRTWQLMAHCLSCFKPSHALHNYLLKSVAILPVILQQLSVWLQWYRNNGGIFSKPGHVWLARVAFESSFNCFRNERFAFFILPESTGWDQKRYGLATRKGGSGGRGWLASANPCQSRFFATFPERSRSKPRQITGPFRKKLKNAPNSSRMICVWFNQIRERRLL